MPFSDLENFKVLAEKLNFTRAASLLYISQSTLSKSIHRLEEKLGFDLFTRNTREVELTAAGKSFYKDTVELLDMYEQSVRRAKNCVKGNSFVRIGGHFANPSIYALADALRNRVKADGLPFEIETNARHVGSIERKPGLDDPYEDALNGDDDIDILYDSSEIRSSSLVTAPLFRERLVAFVSAESGPAQRGSFSIDDLRSMKLITTTTYFAFKWCLLDICRAHEFEPQTRLRVVDSMGDLMRLRSNDEVIVLAESLARITPSQEATGLVGLEVSDDDATVGICAARLPVNDGESVLACWHLLQEITAER